MNPQIDYANLYREFDSKLKKKIFRKPNVVEAKDDFTYLAKSLAAEETHEYAAVFALGKANNSVGEAASLFEAGRLFLRAEETLNETNAFSAREYIDCFVSCSLKAAQIYESIELLTFASNVYIFVGDNLMKYDSFSEALPILSRASDIFCRDAPRSMHVLHKCAQCQLFMRDYTGSLATYQKMQAMIRDACETHNYEIELFLDDLVTTEIFRVLLILITVSPKSKIVNDPMSPFSLDAYSKEKQSSLSAAVANILDPELFLLLRSLMLSHRACDVINVEYTASYLQNYVNGVQRKLLEDILEELINPSGESLLV